MKISLAALIIIIGTAASSFAQMYPKPILAPGESRVSGGLGISWINENGVSTPYYFIGIVPDLQFGKLSVGLDLALRISTNTGGIRKEDWSDGAYRKIIRYVTWGEKGDPVYAKVGQLYAETLGDGFILSNYNNSPSYDNRTIGAVLNLAFHKFGIEAMYGDLHTPGVSAGRVYVRPLEFTDLAGIPLIGGLDLGATYATDQSKDSYVVPVLGESFAPPSPIVPGRKGKMSEYGFDASIPVLRQHFADADIYYAYAQIDHFGHGSAAGLRVDFNDLGPLRPSFRLEHQWIGSEFIPEYFDQFYELNRFVPDDSAYFSKAYQLSRTPAGQGWYGQITVALLHRFNIVGGYRGIAHDPNGGLLHLEVRIPDLMPTIAFSAGYDKWGNSTLKDAFKLDRHSLLYAFFGYKPYSFMTVGLNYYWTYVPVSGGYELQKRFEPRVMLNFSF